MIRKIVLALLAVVVCQFTQAEQAPITAANICVWDGCPPPPPYTPFVKFTLEQAETAITAKSAGCPLHTENTTSNIIFYDDGTYKTIRQSGLELTGNWASIQDGKESFTMYMSLDDASQDKVLSEYQNAFTPCGSNLIKPSILVNKNSATMKFVAELEFKFFSTTIMSGKSVNSNLKSSNFKSKIIIKGMLIGPL
jgi:hypothetical protein